MVRLLPHEVADMEPLLSLIDNQNPNDHEVRKTLFFWQYLVDVSFSSTLFNCELSPATLC